MDHEQLQRELKKIAQQDVTDAQAIRLTAEKAISWSQRNGWIDLLALANMVAAKAYSAQMIFRTALEYYQRAKTLFKDLSDTEQVAHCHAELGRIYYRLAEYSLAIDHFRRALSWVKDTEAEKTLVTSVRINLTHALMNVDYWSDAEQELTKVDHFEFTDRLLVKYQMAVLRLVFYRGDQRAIRGQLKLCRELVYSMANAPFAKTLEYYTARDAIKYGKLKQGERQLTEIWSRADKSDRSLFFLLFETALDVLQSDYPQKGIQWLSTLLHDSVTPLLLQQRVHVALADFFAVHMSHELATEHYQAANRLQREIRDNQVQLQWARFRADEDYQALQKQIAQQKQSNQILAESNALLQAVNRIALSVNSAPDIVSLAERIRDQLSGWVDVHCLTIAELKDDALHFEVVLEESRSLPKEVIPMTEERSWSVRSVREGRIIYDNDFSITDEIRVLDSAHVIRSVAFVPLIWESQILGVLSLQSLTVQTFDMRSISLLEYIKPVIGIAFANLLNMSRTRQLRGELNKQQQALTEVRQIMGQLSEHDELTGLPNQKVLLKEFSHWCRRTAFHCVQIRVKNEGALIHAYGLPRWQSYLREATNRLSAQLNGDSLLLRSSEAYFLILMPLVASSDQLQSFAQQVVNAMIDGEQTTAGPQPEALVSIVQYPVHGVSLDEILSVLAVAAGHAEQDPSAIIIVD